MSPSEELAEVVKNASAGAKQRPGSSLILIPPVTRKSEGINADASSGDANTSSTAGSGFRRAAGLGEGLRAEFKAKRHFLKEGWQRYAVPAALGFCLFGVGLATGGQFFMGANRTAAIGSANPKLAALDTTEMQRATKKLNEEIHALQGRIDTMRASTQTGSSDDVRGLRKTIDSLKASLDAVKAESSAQIAQLNARLEHLQHDEAHLPPLDKPAHNEHDVAALASGATAVHANAQAANTSTASTIHLPAPSITGSTTQHASLQHGDTQTALAGPPLPKDQVQPPSPDAKKKPERLLVDWVVRDVYRGVALIDGPDGTIEVAKGDTIQGIGTVESIEHRNGGWVLVTNRGVVGSVRE